MYNTSKAKTLATVPAMHARLMPSDFGVGHVAFARVLKSRLAASPDRGQLDPSS